MDRRAWWLQSMGSQRVGYNLATGHAHMTRGGKNILNLVNMEAQAILHEALFVLLLPTTSCRLSAVDFFGCSQVGPWVFQASGNTYQVSWVIIWRLSLINLKWRRKYSLTSHIWRANWHSPKIPNSQPTSPISPGVGWWGNGTRQVWVCLFLDPA